MKKILIVDDAPTVIKLVKFSLEDEFEVESASNGQEALVLIGQNQYDLGIFDINMPGINGIELTRQAKLTPNGAGMKIIILTTESSDEMRQRGKEAGALGWMTKPFKEQDLRDLMNTVFSG